MTQIAGGASAGVSFKRKYRWIVALLKGEPVVPDDWFVRVSERPPAPIPYPEGCRFDMKALPQIRS